MWFSSTASTLFAKHPARCTVNSTVIYSPKHGSVTSVLLTLPVPALQLHILGVPPAEVLSVGQAVHTPEEGWTYSFTSQTAWRRCDPWTVRCWFRYSKMINIINTNTNSYTAILDDWAINKCIHNAINISSDLYCTRGLCYTMKIINRFVALARTLKQ